MTSPYSWAHDPTCTHRFYRGKGEHRRVLMPRFNIILKGTSAVNWICPGTSPCYQNLSQILSAPGLEPRTLPAQSPTHWFAATHFAFLCVNGPNTTCCRRSCWYNLGFNPVKPAVAEALIWRWTPCHHTAGGNNQCSPLSSIRPT